MDRDNLKAEWKKLAPAWIREAREGANPTRTGLLDALVLKACGDVTGLRVMDCGCGEGRFCRILSERGAAYALGMDLCAPMIESANKLPMDNVEYRVADVQNMNFLDDNSFDLAVSYLNQCDLPDFKANNREVFRVLKPGGRFVVANLHPMRSAVGGWQWSETGERMHVILDNYLDESERHWKIMDVELTNFHRSLATYINDFIATGFQLEQLMEPTVTPENLEKFPGMADELRVPNFIIYNLRKL